MKPRLLILCTLVIPCLFAACSSVESPEHTFSTFEENGVPVALSSGGPKYTQPLFTYEELYRLQQDESREETILGSTGPCRMDADGNVYVSDGPNHRIAVFDNTGRFIRSFGREGHGPGEFSALRIQDIWKDQIYVNDNRQRRVSIFRTDGDFVDVFTYPLNRPRPPIFFTTMAAYPAPDNRVVLFQQGATQLDGKDGLIFRIGIETADGEELIELVTRPAPMPGTFTGAGIFHFVPGRGILHVKCPEPEMEWFDLDGTLQQIIRVDIEREPVTAEDRATVRADIQAAIENEQQTYLREWAQRELEDLSFPELKDVWFGAQVDAFGYIWAGEPEGSYFSLPHRRKMRIINPEGEYLGDTWFPDVSGASVTGVPSLGHLIMSWEDVETGAPVIAVFRVRSTIRGFTYP